MSCLDNMQKDIYLLFYKLYEEEPTCRLLTQLLLFWATGHKIGGDCFHGYDHDVGNDEDFDYDDDDYDDAGDYDIEVLGN